MKNITPEELNNLIIKKNICLIDVRTKAEFDSEYIQGAYHVPMDEIHLKNIPQSDFLMVLYCRSGLRTTQAYEKLHTLKADLNLACLNGGILAWKKAGYPTIQSGRKHFPIERQVFIIAGFLVFLGTILGAFVHNNFYFIPAFVGLGLVFAGITGWCGMAILLAKMPWNQS